MILKNRIVIDLEIEGSLNQAAHVRDTVGEALGEVVENEIMSLSAANSLNIKWEIFSQKWKPKGRVIKV